MITATNEEIAPIHQSVSFVVPLCLSREDFSKVAREQLSLLDLRQPPSAGTRWYRVSDTPRNELCIKTNWTTLGPLVMRYGIDENHYPEIIEVVI